MRRAGRYTADGVEEITLMENAAFGADDNLLIKGDNLSVLLRLRQVYKGKVQCIYIDPPFNTGNGGFSYNDKFTRAEWLAFMRVRLQAARELLTRDGNIFIHIGSGQSHYLKILCDEIFGEENFAEEIIWAYGSPSGGRAATPKPVNVHDYILHYAASYGERKQNRVYTPYSDKYIADWFKHKDGGGRAYQLRQRGSDASGAALWKRQYLDESKGVPLSTVWSDIKQVYADPRAYRAGQKTDVEVIREFSGGQKPEALLRRIFQMCTDKGDLILDFFCGTGTALAAAHKMGLRYIGVERMDYIETIIIPRLIKVINGGKAGISKDVNWQGGGSFVYCDLTEENVPDVLR